GWPVSGPGMTVSTTASVTPSRATTYGAPSNPSSGSCIASWFPRTCARRLPKTPYASRKLAYSSSPPYAVRSPFATTTSGSSLRISSITARFIVSGYGGSPGAERKNGPMSSFGGPNAHELHALRTVHQQDCLRARPATEPSGEAPWPSLRAETPGARATDTEPIVRTRPRLRRRGCCGALALDNGEGRDDRRHFVGRRLGSDHAQSGGAWLHPQARLQGNVA